MWATPLLKEFADELPDSGESAGPRAIRPTGAAGAVFTEVGSANLCSS